VVVCRAFASLADFVASSRGMVDARTLRVAMKGRVPTDEIQALPKALDVEVVAIEVPRLPAERHLVLMREH
jgi:16S rRNA (guanine527-N7)-methyltransferase